ncbi:MAG: tetratricopeptide repeat protein [Candidatus Aminicenantia bacterium]
MKKYFALILPLLLLFFGAKKKEYELILDEIKNLTARVSALEQRLDTNYSDVLQIYQTVKIISEQLKQIQKDILELKEYTDSNTSKITSIEEKFTQLQTSLSNINQILQRVPPHEETQTIPTQEQPSAPVEVSPLQAYYTAYSDYIKGNYTLAIAGFRDFYEKNKSSPMADNALYWIGECYYSLGKYEDAIREFDNLITNYPKADNINSAHLKKGYALIELRRYLEAKSVLKELIQRAPLSEEAKLAEQKLKTLE